MKKYTLLLVVLISLLTSCAKDEGPFGEIDVNLDDTTQVISYKNDIQPIFNAYCVSCHSASHSKLNLLGPVSYSQLQSGGFSAPYFDTNDPEASRIYKSLKGVPTIMPPSGAISQADISKVLLWIKKGAEND